VADTHLSRPASQTQQTKQKWACHHRDTSTATTGHQQLQKKEIQKLGTAEIKQKLKKNN